MRIILTLQLFKNVFELFPATFTSLLNFKYFKPDNTVQSE